MLRFLLTLVIYLILAMIKFLPKSKILFANSQTLSIIIFNYSSKPLFQKQNNNQTQYKTYNKIKNPSSINAQSTTKIELADFDPQKWRIQLSHSKQIKDFDKISHSLQFLRIPQLALFLQKFYPYLNLKAINQNEKLFERIQNRLKIFSQSLKIQAHQLIQILKFHVKVRSLKKDLDFYHNYGFEKYASITASNFLFDKKLNINQTIFAFSSIVPLGDSHLNLFINFLKYFKVVVQQQPQSLKLEHYLTILNTKFAKRNDIILQNTSYDHVLFQLLKNLQQLLKGVSITFKTQTLCTLLKIDNRISYITDSQKHVTQTIKLMKQLTNLIGEDWFSKSWLSGQQNESMISMINVVHIADCMLFVRNNMINYQNYQQEISVFCEKVYASIKIYFINILSNPTNTIISQKNMHLLIRLALNPLIVPLWIKDNTIFIILYSIFSNFNIKNPQTFLPLAKAIDQFSHQKQILSPLLLLAFQIAKQNLQKNIILKDLIIICLQNNLQINTFSEYFLKLNKDQIENNLTFLLFIEKLTSSKKLFHTQLPVKIDDKKATNFMNELYTLTLSSKSLQGFEKSLQILSEHSQTIYGLINPFQNNDNKKSERNHFLSRESLQLCNIIFFNIINGTPIPQNLKKMYDRLIQNNILLYHILKKMFREDYPLPNIVERPRFFGDFTVILKNVLHHFQSMDRYSYFVWDSMVKLYSTQPLHIRQQSFPQIQKCFLSTIRKQKARKVILTMNMMKLIASGVIIGPRPKLQQLFQLTIDDVLSAQDNKAFYYKCYVQIIFSAIAADVLTPIYFDKIISCCLKRDENMKHTSVIMLIYGASLKGRNLVGGVVDPTIISKQSIYIQRLINERTIRPPNEKSTNFFTITLNNEVICYLFSFGTLSIMRMDSIIYEYIENCKDFSKWRTMVNCYTPQNYSMLVKEQAKFRGKINTLFIDKLIYFKRLKMISEKQETYFIDKFK